MTVRTGAHFFKPCPKCEGNVHRNSRVCQNCGAQSPWATGAALSGGFDASGSSAVAASEPPAPHTEPAPQPEKVEAPEPVAGAFGSAISAAAANFKAEQEAVYIALDFIRTSINGNQLVLIEKGRPIPSHLVDQFKAAGLPIATVGDAEHIIACPACRFVFDARIAKAKGRAAPAA